MLFICRNVGLGMTVLALLTIGCAREAPKATTPVEKKENAEKAHDHGDWWCAEHGVPESECGQCDAKVAAACKKSGDWCAKHDRPQSQCFVCDASLQENFNAKYRTHYGKEPPPLKSESKTKP